MNSNSVQDRQRGFTLVEMMVSVAVATILMLILVKFVQSATTAIVAGEDTLYSTNDAQTAMDLISQDIQSVKLVPMPMNLPGVASSYGSPLEVAEVYGGSDDTIGVPMAHTANASPQDAAIFPVELYLYATPPAATFSGTTPQDNGVPHLIRYMVAWQDPTVTNGTFPSLGLYRSISSGLATSTTVNAALQAEGGSQTPTSLRTVFNGGVPGINDLLVSNVIDFQVLIFDPSATRTSGSPAPPIVPFNAPASENTTAFYYASTSNQMSETLHLSSQGLFLQNSITPTPYNQLYAEIRMVMLSQAGATLYGAGAFPLNFTNTSAINPISKYVHVYTRRVPIIN